MNTSMKTMKNTGLGLLVSLIAFMGSCGNIFDSVAKDKPSNGGAGDTGTLSITIPAISARLAAALSTMDTSSGSRSPDSRAFLFASRAELELRDAQGTVIDTWTSAASTELFPTTTADMTRSVPAGTGYSLSARVFNDKVSLTEPVVRGTVTGISVVSAEMTTVTMPCIPNETLFPDTLAVGTTTGTLEGSSISSNTPPIPLVAIGQEVWFRIVPSTGKNRIELSLSSTDNDTAGYISLFNSDGSWMGRHSIFGPGDTTSVSASVVDTAFYYIGICLISGGTSPSTGYSLTLAESTNANLLTNSDFSDGMNGWELHTSAPGSATMSVENGELKIHIETGGAPVSDNLVLFQRGIPITAGSTYRIGFNSRVSTGDLDVLMMVGDYGNVLGDGETPGSMTNYGSLMPNSTVLSQWTEDVFGVTGPATENAYIVFQLVEEGVSNVDLFLDDVILVEVPQVFAAPASLTATQSGRNVQLSWEAVEGATEYVVTRNEADGGPFYSPIYTGSDTSYTDTYDWYGRELSYKVIARSPAGIGAASTQTIILAAKPVEGTIKNTGLAEGNYNLIIKNPLKGISMTGTVTLDTQGMGSFTIPGGEVMTASELDWYVAFIDTVTGPYKSTAMNTDERVSVPVSITYAAENDGTISDMQLWDWSTAGILPVLAKATRSGATNEATLIWWDLRPRSPTSVLIQKSTSVNGTYVTVTPTNPMGGVDTVSNDFHPRSCTDTTATTGTRWYYRIGVDANANGTLDSGEYETETNTND